MDNFHYSIQLSDQAWAEFSAATEECGLLQAGLASGDELLSSDIDQGDSSGSSPPGPPPLLTGQLVPGGRGWRGSAEGAVAVQGQVSGPPCEPALALGASQQAAGTYTQLEAPPAPCSGATLPSRSSPVWPAAPREDMQRLLQGPAPSPPGGPPQSPEPAARSTTPQKPTDSPGASPRSPGRKKRRTVGVKKGGRSGAPGPVAQPGSPLLAAHPAVEGPGLSGPAKDRPEPDSADAPEQVARGGPGLDLPTSGPITEQGAHQIRMTPRAEPHKLSVSAQDTPPAVSMAGPDAALSTPASKPAPNMGLPTPASEPDMAVSTLSSKPQPNMAVSTPASKPQPDVAVSTPAFKSQSDLSRPTPALKPQPDIDLSTPASKPQLDMAVSTPASKPQPDIGLSTPASVPVAALPASAFRPLHGVGSAPASTPHLPTAGAGAPAEVETCTPALGAQPGPESDAGVVTPEHRDEAAEPSRLPAPQAESVVEVEVIVPSEGHQEKPGEPSAGVGPPLGPMPAPKRKKVRFSMDMPSPEEPGLGEAQGPTSPATGWPSAPRMATGDRGGSAAWDAVAVGPRSPQPRILKRLPPPAPSASLGSGPGSCFAVTLPEAYEFFFCDTIEEEDEDAEEEAVAGQLGEVQWPDTCEFFFRDYRAQRSGHRGGCSPAPPPRAEPGPATLQGDPLPISIPEAYEHFFGEDRSGGELPPGALLQLRTSEPLPEVGPGTPAVPSPASAEQLSLALGQAGELGRPFTSSALSQKDMCLVFVAFATWAVRTSDLHAPDAWKTVLLANIGTISAIRYFRQRVGRGRSPSS